MSAAPDPAELAPSRDPAAYGRRPLFTAGFFAWISLCVICVVAGAAVGRFGVALAPVRSDTADTDTRAAVSATAPIVSAAPSASPVTQSALPASSPDTSALGDRVSRLEAASGRVDNAAAEALAAASLSVAAEGSAPFGQDLAAYERLSPDDPDLRALAPLAALGAPSRAALGAAFPDLATQAALAARQPAKDADFLTKLGALVGRVVIIRRVGADAPGLDGVLYRAQMQAAAGDLDAALASLRALPAAAQAPLKDWMAGAERRVEIDRRLAAVRARALAALASPTGVAGSP